MNNVCQQIVSRNMCVGCGVCAGVCPQRNLEMHDGPRFGYIPVEKGSCMESCSVCVSVCPFSDHGENEDSLAEKLYAKEPEINHRAETGYYRNAYAGYVSDPEHRWKGGSGGVASWFLSELLIADIVDYVICVVPNKNPKKLFTFEVVSDPNDVKQSAKPVYYPVELSEAVQKVLAIPGRYALIGLPCFVKAVRLASAKNKKLYDRLVVCAGLVCGQLNSKGFTETLVRKMDLNPDAVSEICFREKKEGRSARSYGVFLRDLLGRKVEFSDFKYFWRLWHISALRSCNYCDDVFAETADIVFMDAWLPEYMQEAAGTNLLVTRSAMADQILNELGICTNKVTMQQIPIEQVIRSQQGVINNKRKMLSFRLWLSREDFRIEKRVATRMPDVLSYLACRLKFQASERCIEALCAQREAGNTGIDIFDRKMKKYLFLFQLLKIPKKAIALLNRMCSALLTNRIV